MTISAEIVKRSKMEDKISTSCGGNFPEDFTDTRLIGDVCPHPCDIRMNWGFTLLLRTARNGKDPVVILPLVKECASDQAGCSCENDCWSALHASLLAATKRDRESAA